MSDYKNQRPKVGVGVIVICKGKILLGKRKNSHGEGTWSLPGGHLEYAESLEECAVREVMEEAGIKISNIKLGPYTNDIFSSEKKHYITLFAVCELADGKPSVMESEKCERWEWFDWDNLPQPLFLPIENLLKQDFNPINFLQN